MKKSAAALSLVALSQAISGIRNLFEVKYIELDLYKNAGNLLIRSDYCDFKTVFMAELEDHWNAYED